MRPRQWAEKVRAGLDAEAVVLVAYYKGGRIFTAGAGTSGVCQHCVLEGIKHLEADVRARSVELITDETH